MIIKAIFVEFIDRNTIKLKKISTLLDKFVINLCRILENHTDYVIVSGYVSILFGRARATEDIDILIEKISQERFYKLYSDLTKKGYRCVNIKDRDEIFNMMLEGLGVRFAKRKNIIPNAEIKFAKNNLERDAIKNSLKVITLDGYMRISRIELQIAYKEKVLGSEKDLEDAKHLETVFKDKIDKELLEKYRKRLEK